MRSSSHLLSLGALLLPLATAQSTSSTLITSTLPDPTPAVAIHDAPYVGCYPVDSSLKLQYGYIYQTNGWCQKVCLALSSPAAVMGLANGAYCYCGDALPSGTAVDKSKCDTACAGYGDIQCGGSQYWSVYSTGLKQDLQVAAPGSNTSSIASGTSSTSVSSAAIVSTVTQGGTVFVTSVIPTSSAAGNSNAAGSGSNVGGIVAGVVVGIVILAALVGGVLLIVSRRKKRAIEAEHRRAAASSELMASKRAQASSPFDTRLEPVMLQKRQSDGSIADHQDYSRRILKVVNPDGQ